MGGFFVDPAPSGRVERPQNGQSGRSAAAPGQGQNGESKRVRAADRRREEGRAPEPQGPKDTRTSLKQGQQQAAVDVEGTLSCVRGPEAGVVLSLGNGSFTVGRGRDNELVLKDIAASRKHLRIDVDGRRVRLVDLGSGNGTKVNGKRAGELELRHGDTIEIGSSVLVYAEPGRQPPPIEQNRDEAQARVVAAADELAKELSERLRFGADGPAEGFDDGHVAKTRALRTADARAVAEQIAREAQEKQQQQQQQQQQPKKAADRLWSETFTNMPLSAVVPADHSLQGGGGNRNEAPTADPPRQRARPAPLVQSAAPRSMAPMGTAQHVDDEESILQEYSESGPRRGSFLTSVLLSAGVVVIVGAIALGFWAIFFKDEGAAPGPQVAGSVVAEREAEYGTAIRRAQDAYAREDWLAVREYAIAALQVKPKDVMATSYQRDADIKLTAALAAAKQPTPTPTPTPPPAPPPPNVQVAPVVTPPPPPEPRRVDPPRQRPKPKPRAKGMSDSDAQAQFERAIDAFRSKDNDTGCNLLDRVADRAPADSVWKGKAENLFLKKCGG